LSAAIVASWARYAEGTDEEGEPIKVVDRLADSLTKIANTQRDEPLAFVRNQQLFGSLAEESAFTEPYLKTLESLHERGARATLEDLVPASGS
jgi:mannitol 2-dehydrogenase